MVQLLVQKGANISAFDVEGMTPLLSAVRNGHMEVLEYLIDNGADVKVKNFYNGTALSIARTLGDSMMVQRLQPYFGDEETNPDPYNVLFSMLQRESAVFLQVLMEETGWIVEQTLHAVDFLARRGPEYMQPTKLGEVLHDVVANFPQHVEDAHNAVVRSQAFVQIELSGALYRLAERMPGAVEMVQSAGRSVVAFSQQQYSVFRKSDTANIFRQLGAFVLKTLDRNYSRKQRQAAAQTCAAGSSCAGAAPGVSEL